MVYWLDMFLSDCESRVSLKSTVKGVKLSARTLEDYRDAVGTDAAPGALRMYFAPPMMPLDVLPEHVQTFLRDNAKAGRPTRGNRDKACLSSCFGWLLREGKIEGLRSNPCLRGSGVQRNPEAKRTRYVTNDLQRPESDIILWDLSSVSNDASGRYLRFKQNKTGRDMVIAMRPEISDLIPLPAGGVRRLHERLVKRLNGEAYTYDGLSSMLKRSIAAANLRRKARGIAPMTSFGFRDLKGKGATDIGWPAIRSNKSRHCWAIRTRPPPRSTSSSATKLRCSRTWSK